MPKSAFERKLEQNQRETKKLADEEALRLRASSIVNGQETIDGFRVIDVNAEIILKHLLNLCNDIETGHVQFDDDAFPAQFQHGISLELEKLTQYGMLNVYTKWWGGGIINLLPAAFVYFEEKEKAIQRKELKTSASVENHYHASANVITGEVTASAIVAGDGNCVDVSTAPDPDPRNYEVAGLDHDHSIANSIFISHRSSDKAVADMLLDFFIGCGVPREAVFCSSLPGNDVQEKISKEVKAALVISTINIAILSNDYYESVYCLNEAGILWFLDDKLVVPIAMPEITADKMIGFLDSEYKLRRLDNETDITYLLDAVTERLEVADTKYAVVREETRKLIERYSLYLEQR